MQRVSSLFGSLKQHKSEEYSEEEEEEEEEEVETLGVSSAKP